MRKLPPYGSRILKVEKTNKDIFLFCGANAWKKARAFAGESEEKAMRHLMTCLPPWLDPTTYHWPVDGRAVLIFDTGGCEDVYIDKLAYCLHLDGATQIRAIMYDDGLRVFKGGIK